MDDTLPDDGEKFTTFNTAASHVTSAVTVETNTCVRDAAAAAIDSASSGISFTTWRSGWVAMDETAPARATTSTPSPPTDGPALAVGERHPRAPGHSRARRIPPG